MYCTTFWESLHLFGMSMSEYRSLRVVIPLQERMLDDIRDVCGCSCRIFATLVFWRMEG